MIQEHCFPHGTCSNVRFSEVTALLTSCGHRVREALPQSHKILTKNPATLLLTPEPNFYLCSSSCLCQYCSGPLCPAFTDTFSAHKNSEKDLWSGFIVKQDSATFFCVCISLPTSDSIREAVKSKVPCFFRLVVEEKTP